MYLKIHQAQMRSCFKVNYITHCRGCRLWYNCIVYSDRCLYYFVYLIISLELAYKLIEGQMNHTSLLLATCTTDRHKQREKHPRTPKLILSAVVRQTAGINLQTDLGDEDACIQNSFDVLQPAWALQTFQEVRHGGGAQLAHCNHNTAVSLTGSMEHTWSLHFIKPWIYRESGQDMGKYGSHLCILCFHAEFLCKG